MTRVVRRAVAIVLGLVAVAQGGRAEAHQSSVVYSQIAVEGARVDYKVFIAAPDLFEAIPGAIAGSVTREQVRANAASIGAYVLRRIQVLQGEAPCPGRYEGLTTEDKDGGFVVVLANRYECAGPEASLAIRYDLFFDLDPRHQGFARLKLGGGEPMQHVFRGDERRWGIRRNQSLGETTSEYVRLGIEHIVTGADHIAFLLGLLLLAPLAARGKGPKAGVYYTVKVATAFTVAHSLTLAISALHIISVSSRLVEPLIAASIAYVGAEDMRWKMPRHRYALTFCFGLVHGLGFASVLQEIGLPQRGLALALASFNIGVEIGQVCIIAATVPILMVVARRSERAYGKVLHAGSALLVVAGVTWFCLRVF